MGENCSPRVLQISAVLLKTIPKHSYLDLLYGPIKYIAFVLRVTGDVQTDVLHNAKLRSTDRSKLITNKSQAL